MQRWQEHPSFYQLVCVFWYVLFYKNLIVLHYGDNTFLFYFGICIKLWFHQQSQRWRNDNNSIDTWTTILWNCLREKISTKHVTRQNHLIIAKFRILKGLKRFQELLLFTKFVTEVLIFAAANTFFGQISCLSLTVAPVFVLGFFENTS